MSNKSMSNKEIQDVYSTLGLADKAWTYSEYPEEPQRDRRVPELNVVLSQNAYPPPAHRRRGEHS